MAYGINSVRVNNEKPQYIQIETNEGKLYNRKYYVRKYGLFAGKTLFYLWDNVYSYNTALTVISEEDVMFEGKRRSIDAVGTNDDVIDELDEVEQEVQEAPAVVEEVEETGPINHEKYTQIKACVEANVPVFLVGPAGSGKNHVLETIAWDCGMDFFFSNAVQNEYKLTGFIDAGGVYHETEFYKACTCERECIFFLDEMDASIPEVLVLLNAAIANKYFEFPTGRLDCSNVRFVAAGNTFGDGADEQYIGRMVLDQASLDRFVVIKFDYDERVELSIAKGDKQMVRFVREIRKEAENKGIRGTFSYRCLQTMVKLNGVMALDEVLEIAIFKGMDKDTMNTVQIAGCGRYSAALLKLKERVV